MDRCIVLGAAIRTSALLQIATLTDNILQKTARQSVINVLNAELCPKRCWQGQRSHGMREVGEPIPKLRPTTGQHQNDWH